MYHSKLTDRGGCDINDSGCGDCNGRGNRKCIITLYFRSALYNHAFSGSPDINCIDMQRTKNNIMQECSRLSLPNETTRPNNVYKLLKLTLLNNQLN